MSTLADPLVLGQIQAAYRIYQGLAQWKIAETSLECLHTAIPEFGPEACLLKTVAVNAIYSTNLRATTRMSKWILEIMANGPLETGPEMVEKIAALPNKDGEVSRTFTSFAAKFCHFFIDKEVYPIFDEAARATLKHHLGKRYENERQRPYAGFCRNILALRADASLKCSNAELDRYLWITGMYIRWLDHSEGENLLINEELLNFFLNPAAGAADLDTMLPSSLERTFAVGVEGAST